MKKEIVQECTRKIGRVHGGRGECLHRTVFAPDYSLPVVVDWLAGQPGVVIGRHYQPKDEIWLNPSGQSRVRVDNEDFFLGEGQAVLTQAGSWHEQEVVGQKPWQQIVLYSRRNPPGYVDGQTMPALQIRPPVIEKPFDGFLKGSRPFFNNQGNLSCRVMAIKIRPDEPYCRTSFDFHEIVWCLNGSCELTTDDGKQISINPGEAIWLTPDERVCLRVTDPAGTSEVLGVIAYPE